MKELVEKQNQKNKLAKKEILDNPIKAKSTEKQHIIKKELSLDSLQEINNVKLKITNNKSSVNLNNKQSTANLLNKETHANNESNRRKSSGSNSVLNMKRKSVSHGNTYSHGNSKRESFSNSYSGSNSEFNNSNSCSSKLVSLSVPVLCFIGHDGVDIENENLVYHLGNISDLKEVIVKKRDSLIPGEITQSEMRMFKSSSNNIELDDLKEDNEVEQLQEDLAAVVLESGGECVNGENCISESDNLIEAQEMVDNIDKATVASETELTNTEKDSEDSKELVSSTVKDETVTLEDNKETLQHVSCEIIKENVDDLVPAPEKE
ncbi:hypothetical protein HDU92_008857 [Lobulomyces angularis]|nr:hypothetical protein HDU92_008857 [Lobulomyces angularis]